MPAAELTLIPSPDAPVQMRTMVYRPPGNGPFPLAVISHGSSSNPELRADQDLSHFEDIARWFVRRGYAVAIPQRPGHGQTGGEWLEGAGTCEDPHYEHAGVTIAASITATIGTLLKQPFARKTGVVVLGHSAGAWGALALASQNPRPVTAVIDFAGGLGGRSYDWPNRNCAPDRLIKTVEKFGRTARIPTIWIYAKNDTYFGPDLSGAMAAAFRKGGGSVEYHLLPAVGDDGHFLIYDKGAAAGWGSLVDAFLRRHGAGDSAPMPGR